MKTVLITGSTSGIGREFARTGEYNIVFNGLESEGQQISEVVGREFNIPVMFSNANIFIPLNLIGKMAVFMALKMRFPHGAAIPIDGGWNAQ